MKTPHTFTRAVKPRREAGEFNQVENDKDLRERGL